MPLFDMRITVLNIPIWQEIFQTYWEVAAKNTIASLSDGFAGEKKNYFLTKILLMSEWLHNETLHNVTAVSW